MASLPLSSRARMCVSLSNWSLHASDESSAVAILELNLNWHHFSSKILFADDFPNEIVHDFARLSPF